MAPGEGSDPAVTVIIPTFHRPAMLRRAVASVLAQELQGATFEVVIAVSDRKAPEDLAAAEQLALADPRVRVVVADQLGPAVARNTAMAVAAGDLFAFTDDDCEAAPGWLQAGLDRAREVELVQGRTVPIVPRTHRRMKTISVERLSGLWQACNLFVRRSAVDRGGGFDEGWLPLGRPDRPWGEDAEWGWRMIRAGATYGFEEGAVIRHDVTVRTYRELWRDKLALRSFPMLIRRAPELRRYFFWRFFITPQHALLAATFGLLAAGAVSATAGNLAFALIAFGAAAGTLLWPPRLNVVASVFSNVNDMVNLIILLGASLRYGRLVL